MPDVTSVPATLADLSSLFSNQLQTAAQVTISEANLGLTGLGNLLSATGLGSTSGLSVTTPQLSPIANNTLTLAGAITYLNTPFAVSLSFTVKGTVLALSFSAVQATGSTLSLSLLVSKLLPAATNAPALTLTGLMILFDTSASTWMLGGTVDWSFALGANTATMQATLGISQAGAGLMGSLAVGPATFTVGYQIQKGSQVLSGSWTTTGTPLGWYTVVDALGLDSALMMPSSVTIPPALSQGGFNSAQISIDFVAKQVTLSGQTTDGAAFLYAGQQAGKWGVAIGAAAGNNWTFGQLGSGLAPLDFLVFQQAYLLISSFPQTGYTFPNFALMTTPIDVVQGLNFGATVNFATGSTALAKSVHTMLGASTLAVSGSLGTAQNTKISASLGGSMTIPQCKKLVLTNPQLVLMASPLTAEVQGTLRVALSSTQMLDFVGSLSIGTEGASFMLDVTGGQGQSLPAPFGFTGVRLENIGLKMGIGFTPPSIDLGIEAIFQVGHMAADKCALEFQVDPDAVNPILLWGQFSSLSLPVLFEAMFPKIKLPSVLMALNLTNVLVYYCEQPTVLPDNTSAAPGFALNGTLSAFKFTMIAAFKINFSQGVSGLAAMSPIHLAHNAVNVTGQSSLGGPAVQFNTMGSPYLNVTLDASVFDVASVAINGTVTSSGFSFTLQLEAGSTTGAAGFSAGLSCMFADAQNFGASANLAFNLDFSVGPLTAPHTNVNLGTLKINTSFSGTLALKVTSTAIQGSVTGTFDGHTLPALSFTTATATLKDIPKQVVDQIKADVMSIYSDVLGNAQNWASYVSSGAITGADDAGKVLTGYFNESSNDAQALLKQLKLHGHISVHVDTSTPHVDSKSSHVDTAAIHADNSGLHVDTSITHWDVNAFGGHSDSGGHTDRGTHVDGATPHGDTSIHLDTPTAHADSTTEISL